MPQERLDHPKIGACIQEMGSEAVAEHMGSDPFGDPGSLTREPTGALHRPVAQRFGRVRARKEPVVRPSPPDVEAQFLQ